MSEQFSKQAALYAQFRPDYPKEMYDFIFKHLTSRKYAWDCATGSGQIAKYLAKHFDKVYATDTSIEQLSHAPKIANVEYRKSSAEDSGLQANYFDLITVGQAIHWFNFEQFYTEVRRLAKKDALLAVIGYGMVRINESINPIINDLYEVAFGAHYAEARTYIDNEYQTIPFPFKEIQTPKFENTFDWSIDQLEGYFSSWSAIQKMKSDPVATTIRQIKKITSEQNFSVTFPIFMRLGKVA